MKTLKEQQIYTDSQKRNSSEIVFISGTNSHNSEINVLNELVAKKIADSSESKITEFEEVDAGKDVNALVNDIVFEMNKVANFQYKGSTFIEPIEIEGIKKFLSDENCDIHIKTVFEMELDNFQKQIRVNYMKQIREYNEKRMFIESEIEMFEHAKHQIIVRRLSRAMWPYNEQTKEYDKKIATLKIHAERYANRVADLEAMRPAANAKDIIMFQMQLKEKFAA